MNEIRVGTKIRILNDQRQDEVKGQIITVNKIDHEGFWTAYSYFYFSDIDEEYEVVEEYLEEKNTVVNNTVVINNTVSGDLGHMLESPKRIDQHYDFFYELSPHEAQFLQLKVDPYFVSKQWRIGERDHSGALFHILKTIARFGDKNSREREIKAIYLQIKRLAELEGVELE